MKNNFVVPYLPNPGILSGKLSEPIFNKVKTIVLDPLSRKNPYNHKLIASIREEYITPQIPELIEYLDEMYKEWVNLYKLSDVPYVIDSIWTNYMKKGEFNPNHIHPNALAVFVIWIHIPYDINEEMRYGNNQSQCKNSCFELTYNTYDGRIMTFPIPVDKSFEGTVLMFPSRMVHCVYPFFTSDEERVSIAGNIYHIDERRD